MKKFAGMMPPTFVFAEEGKNGLCGPLPSESIVAGGTRGFWMRWRAWRLRSTAGLAAHGTRIAASTAAAVVRGERESAHAATRRAPAAPDTTWAFSAV